MTIRTPAAVLALLLTTLGLSQLQLQSQPASAALRSATSVGINRAWSVTAPGMVAQSAPIVARVKGVRSIVVGDSRGHLRAFAVADGHQVLNIATGASRIDGPLSLSKDGTKIYVPMTSTTLGAAEIGAFSARTGTKLKTTHHCQSTKGCLQLSGVSVANNQLLTGGVQQWIYAMNPGLGEDWSYLTSDSTNSTAASADLAGTGSRYSIFTDDQTPNAKVQALSGGHLRIFTPAGKQVCNANVGPGPLRSPGSFDSSPAVGVFARATSSPTSNTLTRAGTPTIVFGTGASGYAPKKLFAYNSSCQKLWSSPALSGNTIAAPSIADVTNDGTPDVIEYTVPNRNAPATVYVLSGRNGKIVAQQRMPANCTRGAIGTSSSVSVFTADDTQYMLIPAGACGTKLGKVAGAHVDLVQTLGASCAVQNTPVVSIDSPTRIGVTVAGYQGKAGGGGQTCVHHYAFNVAHAAFGPLDWPEFHHDAQLTGSQGLTLAQGRRDTIVTPQSLSVSGRIAALWSSNGRYELSFVRGATTKLVLTDTALGRRRTLLSGVSRISLGANTLTRTLANGKTKTIFSYRSTSLMSESLMHLTLTNTGQLLLVSAHSVRWWPDQKFYNLTKRTTYAIKTG